MSVGWFTVPRVDRDAIIAKLGSERAPTAITVWLGLRDIANSKRSDAVQCSTREIARVAGTSHRTVERALPMLRDIGLVRWDQTRLPETNSLGANVYHVLTLEPPATMAEPPADKAGPPAKVSEKIGGVLDRNTGKTGNTRRKAPPPAGELNLESKPLKEQKRDLVFEEVAKLHGGHVGLTASKRGRINRAIKEIEESCRQTKTPFTVEEVSRRISHLKQKHHDFSNAWTASCLASDWHELAQPPQVKMNGTPSADLTRERQHLATLRSASAREKQDSNYKTRLTQAEARVAQLEGRTA